jgi:hypothetical protein
MKINNYNYEWTRAFHTLFSEIITELGEVCDSKTCPKITAGPDWEYICMNHDNLKNITCTDIDYCTHTLDTNILLLTNPIYFPDREKISYHSAKALPKIVRYFYRMLAHTYCHHKNLFDSLEEKYRIGERLTLYCKEFNLIDHPEEYCIKI